MRITTLLLVLTLSSSVFADESEIPCARVDLRIRAKEMGWPRTPHQGGRASASSLALAEAIGMKIGKAVTPLDLDRALSSGETPEAAVARLSSTGFCPLTEGPMDDVAFSRDPIVIPKTGCDENPERRLPPSKLTLASLDVSKIDGTLEASIPVVATWDSKSSSVESLIVGRRFNVDLQRCEWLVRGMGGPFCRETPCEDGATWVRRGDPAIRAPRVIR